MRKILCLLVFAVLAYVPGHGEIVDAGEYLKQNVVTRKLKNGITLILLNRGYAPVLAFDISFRVGSADETYNTAGAAHLLEHMLFKGTDRLGTNDFGKEGPIQARIEAVGETLDRLRLESPSNSRIAELEKELKLLQEQQQKYIVSSPYDKLYTEKGGVGLNASTSADKTGYYIELPTSQIELWARIESERLRNPVMREFYQERNNIIQERLMAYDSNGPGGLFELFKANAFTAHPYRHPIIGWKSNIPFLSLREVKQFYRKYYIPSRMTITIIGKQDTDATIAVVEKYFGSIPARPEPEEIPVREPEQSGEKRLTYHFASNPVVFIGWHKPAFPARDDVVFEVVSELLGRGKTSRLHKSLVLDKKIASAAESANGYPGGRYDNLFVVFATPAPRHTSDEVEKAMYEEIEKLASGVPADELEKVKIRLESDLVFQLSSNKGLASELTYFQVVYGDWKYLADYVSMVRSVTADEVKAVTRKYLTEKNRTVGILVDSRKKEGDEK